MDTFGKTTSGNELEYRERDADAYEVRQALEQFIYAVSHDLRAPVRQITGFSEVLKRELNTNNEKVDTALSFLIAGAARMNSILDDLVEYSRIESRKGVPVYCDTTECCEAALAASGFDQELMGSSLRLASLPEVFVDRGHLISVFRHLIRNAEAASHSPFTLTVSGKQTERLCTFSVTDNGRGIAEEDWERIFGVFVVVGRKKREGGNGIGLSLVRRICRHYGGDAWIESSSPRGTTVCFSLPARDPSRQNSRMRFRAQEPLT